jgi:hypothetical protein
LASIAAVNNNKTSHLYTGVFCIIILLLKLPSSEGQTIIKTLFLKYLFAVPVISHQNHRKDTIIFEITTI